LARGFDEETGDVAPVVDFDGSDDDEITGLDLSDFVFEVEDEVEVES
jgi:hypothetical protein